MAADKEESENIGTLRSTISMVDRIENSDDDCSNKLVALMALAVSELAFMNAKLARIEDMLADLPG